MNSNELFLTARGTVLVRNMSDRTGPNSPSTGLLVTSEEGFSALESFKRVAESQGVGRRRVVFLFYSPLHRLYFSSCLHQGTSRYQQPGPRWAQVHHEVERPLTARAGRGGGPGGLSKQRHPLPTEREQKADQHLLLRYNTNKATGPVSVRSLRVSALTSPHHSG